jgi:hypothetical protein
MRSTTRTRSGLGWILVLQRRADQVVRRGFGAGTGLNLRLGPLAYIEVDSQMNDLFITLPAIFAIILLAARHNIRMSCNFSHSTVSARAPVA